jgi:hypothetical protein
MQREMRAIEAEMSEARQRLALARSDLRRAGSRWRDWRTHLQAHPAWVGFALGAVGYLLVPGRRRSPRDVGACLRSSPPERPVVARALGAGLQYSLQHLVPLVAGVLLERIQSRVMAPREAPPDGYAAPRRPR